MADYCYLVVDCIDDVPVKVRRRDGGLLNRRQCGYLAQELLKVSESVRARGAESLERGMQRTVLLHLDASVKRAHMLVTRCCCESSSWLAAAMALGDTKEEVVAKVLGFRQWSFLLEIAIIGACSGPGGAIQSAQVQELLETGEESYQRSSKQQSKMRIAVQDVARQDREELLKRIAELTSVGEEARRDEDFIRGVYLEAQLKHSEPGNLQSVEGLTEHALVGPLGSGSYGMVMKVKWWGKEVALKILSEISRTEATLLSQVLHPNIVRLFHYWEEQSPRPHSRFLMELMPGDLRQHIEIALEKRSASPRPSEKGDSTGSMPFPLPVAIDIMLQVAQAMRHVHEKKLTHRDLKTSNILVKPVSDEYLELHVEGYLEVKLADFGSSKAYTKSSITGDLTRNTGTTVYGAPEIFGKEEIVRERNFPPKADVWSFELEQLDRKPNMSSYSVLRAATRDVHSDMWIPGHGGDPSEIVSRGVMPSGSIVAVKLTRSVQSTNFSKKILYEITVLTRMNHRNLVNLKGCCFQEQQGLLVYELSAYILDVHHIWILRRAGCDLVAASEYILGRCSRLALSARAGIFIHRDIEAANISSDHSKRGN